MSLQANHALGLLKDSLPQPVVAFWCAIFRSMLYQPPVGIVTWWVTTQWLQRLLFPNNPLGLLDNPLMGLLNINKRPKSVELDAMDREYNTLGGVQSIALRQASLGSNFMDIASVPPQATRLQCAKQSVETLLQVLGQNQEQQQDNDIATILQVRALDALLRWIRDEELLPLAEKLRSRKKASESELNSFTTPRQVIKRGIQLSVQRMLRKSKRCKSLEECRGEFQDTSQRLQDQYQQLGRLQEHLLQQPQPGDNPNHMKECAQWNAQAKALLQDLLSQHKDLCLTKSSSWSPSEWRNLLQFLNDDQASLRKPKSLLDKMTGKYRNIVPSAVWKIAFAKLIHHLLLPHWPWIKSTGHEVATAAWGIVEFRFYKPLKVIVMDLLNRRPRLLDSAMLNNEQDSLHNMLRDLGISVDDMDSNEALAQASRMYEEQLKNGAVKNMIFGRMIRLLLIQVQQLKAELLQAFQSIDELVDANRLNVSLLAIIPAFLLVRWGSRALYSLMYRLRVRDLTGLHNAHSELTHRLRTLERILILADDGQLKGAQLGEFISQQQKYLLLLDYCQPPFPVKQVDSIYQDMQDLLPPGGLDRETQASLLKLIQQKNMDLIKSL